MAASFLLVNANVAQPPVSPVGLEYVGESLVEDGVAVQVLDLAFEDDWKNALAGALSEGEPQIVGISVRNTDDCSFATGKSFLPWIKDVVSEVKRLTPAFVLLGGVGFSVMPEAVLEFSGADAGIAGDGEELAPALVRCLRNKQDFSQLPNLVRWHDGSVFRNITAEVDLKCLPLPRRRLFDNRRYEEQGAMVGIETKRGCPQQCIYCADPVAKGDHSRLRTPAVVIEEFRDLLDQGVSWFHLCDSEFNIPLAHAKSVCRAIIESGLSDRLRWYTYCSPAPFDRELADLMKRAGCAGINFGVDSLYDEQLSRLGRFHTAEDVRKLVLLMKAADLNYMFDLLVGGPGETEETVRATIAGVRELDVPLVGIAAGVRVYTHTSLGKAVADGSLSGGLHPATVHMPYEPLFYLSPSIDGDVFALVGELVGGDTRFLQLSSPSDESSYNYADDEPLCRMIRAGARGAYWDIIRRNRG